MLNSNFPKSISDRFRFKLPPPPHPTLGEVGCPWKHALEIKKGGPFPEDTGIFEES